MLQNMGYAPGRDLFGYPYDWRQSPHIDRIQQPLVKRLLQAYQCRGRRKVTIIAHSLGCLVVRALLQRFPATVEATVQRIIFMGAPFNGASRMLQAFISGYNFDLPVFVAPIPIVHKIEVSSLLITHPHKHSSLLLFSSPLLL